MKSIILIERPKGVSMVRRRTREFVRGSQERRTGIRRLHRPTRERLSVPDGGRGKSSVGMWRSSSTGREYYVLFTMQYLFKSHCFVI